MDFSEKLIDWYKNNKRDLPWRNTKDPYYIWLSEIMLQQTRVEQGRPYYIKFTEEFPTILDLAKASEQKVLKMWQGLGYYSRARNMHFASKQVKDLHKGIFPVKYEEVIALKGVGDYSAAAIVSFAYNKPFAVVDGNVYRVLSRLFDIEQGIDTTEGKKLFKELANELLDKKRPGLYNQAIMEFGATYCKPTNPNCVECIFNDKCLALKNKTVALRPFKSKKVKVKHRYINYFVFEYKNWIAMNIRTAGDVWQGLYDFPSIESEELFNGEEKKVLSDLKKSFNIKEAIKIENKKTVIHILTHQRLHINFFVIRLKSKIKFENKGTKFYAVGDVRKLPVPVVVHNYLEKRFEI